MTVRQINQALRDNKALFARGQFRAFRVCGARSRKGQKELRIVFGVINGRAYSDWVQVRGFGMVVEARNGSFL